MERKRIQRYNSQSYQLHLSYSRLGVTISLLGLIAITIVDIFLFGQNNIVIFHRVVFITLEGIVLAVSIVNGERELLNRIIFGVSICLSLFLETYILVNAYLISPEYYAHEYVLYMLFLVGALMFGGVMRYRLSIIYLANLALFVVFTVLFGVSEILITFQAANILFMSVGFAVFNHYYLLSHIELFEAVEHKNNRIEELNEEIEKRKQLQYRLKEMATYDGLTNSYTRRTGLDILEKDLQRNDEGFYSLSICYIDINNLKVINDIYGHQIGDIYIVGLVNILNEVTRQHDYVIRLGGDEFLLVMPDATYYFAERIWREIAGALESFRDGKEVDYPLEVSHGIVEYVDGNYENVELLLNAADELMYKEKRDKKIKHSLTRIK